MNLVDRCLATLRRCYQETFHSRRLRLTQLRQGWGKPVARERNMDLIALYHDFLPGSRVTVDPGTWRDLDVDAVFATLDRTTAMLGRQTLYHQLRTYEADPLVLAERTRQYAVFRSDASLREACQLLLARLDGPGAAWLAPLLLSELPSKPWFAPLLYLCSGLSLLCLAGLCLDPHFLLPALALIATNLALNETYGRRISPYLPGFCQIERLLGVSAELAQLPEAQGLPQLTQCHRLQPDLTRLRQKIQWQALDRTWKSGLWQSFVAYLNMFFLVDILAFTRALGALRQHQAQLVTLLDAVGSLDAALAVASYLEGLPYATTPHLSTERRIQVAGLYHPMLAAPVGNDLDLADRSALITGSNMAGKTTFIRTVGINLLLARTLHICLAREAQLPLAVVRSSIHREDALGQGQSYYFAELERILQFIQEGAEGPQHLFLIDEIYRGTNTVERLASATAVLSHLSAHHLVLATTHDIELQSLLQARFDTYHFKESIRAGACHFDYLIQPGPARSRNAIKLLELQGYPATVVAQAKAVADQLDNLTAAAAPAPRSCADHPALAATGPVAAG